MSTVTVFGNSTGINFRYSEQFCGSMTGSRYVPIQLQFSVQLHQKMVFGISFPATITDPNVTSDATWLLRIKNVMILSETEWY